MDIDDYYKPLQLEIDDDIDDMLDRSSEIRPAAKCLSPLSSICSLTDEDEALPFREKLGAKEGKEGPPTKRFCVSREFWSIDDIGYTEADLRAAQDSRPPSPTPTSNTPGYLSPDPLGGGELRWQTGDNQDALSEIYVEAEDPDRMFDGVYHPDNITVDAIPAEYLPSRQQMDELMESEGHNSIFEEEIAEMLEEVGWGKMVATISEEIIFEKCGENITTEDFNREVYARAMRKLKEMGVLRSIRKVIEKPYDEVLHEVSDRATHDNYARKDPVSSTEDNFGLARARYGDYDDDYWATDEEDSEEDVDTDANADNDTDHDDNEFDRYFGRYHRRL